MDPAPRRRLYSARRHQGRGPQRSAPHRAICRGALDHARAAWLEHGGRPGGRSPTGRRGGQRALGGVHHPGTLHRRSVRDAAGPGQGRLSSRAGRAGAWLSVECSGHRPLHRRPLAHAFRPGGRRSWRGGSGEMTRISTAQRTHCTAQDGGSRMSWGFPGPARKGSGRKVHPSSVLVGLLALLVGALLLGAGYPLGGAAPEPTTRPAAGRSHSGLRKRWLFVWRDMSDPKEVDRMIARFPRARVDGYNGVAFSYNIPASKAVELRQAARQNGLDIIAIVMGGSHDRNYVEGVLSKDALFVAHDG